jgi:3-oxoacyl-[acyl-carrier protein] reductase
MNLDIVVVTGAGRGVGRAIALRFGEAGIPVLCIARTETAKATQETIVAAGGVAESYSINLADPAHAVESMAGWMAKKSYRRIGVVLAAGTLGRGGGLHESDLADWSTTFQTNVLGNLAILRALLPRMLETRFGRIVTFAGGGAAYAYPLFSAYAISKAAIVRATENLDVELKGKGDFLTVCLAPGAMDTSMLQQVRAAGGEVRTVVPMSEAVEFVWEFLHAANCGFSGRFVHVRDEWRAWLGPTPLDNDRWLLRRIEK